MNKKIKPIFILSVPRSGSSLMLSILSAHKKIAGMAETWLLLPFLYANKEQGTLTNYCHTFAYQGLTDLITNLPGKENQYNIYLREFFENLYGALAENHDYFLDKTPRYYFIIPELIKIFPDAKFIFIFRNPVQIFASWITTFGENRFSIFGKWSNYFNLIEGPKLLSTGYELIKDKAYKLQYEQFVNDPEKYLKEILDYLELDFDKELLSNFNPSKLAGRHLDPNVFEYGSSIEKSTVEKWREVFNTNFRKRIITNYITNLSEETLNVMGYNKSEIISDIKNLKPNGHYNLIRDIIDYYFMKLKNRYNRISYS